jgi:hypothetical protein
MYIDKTDIQGSNLLEKGKYPVSEVRNVKIAYINTRLSTSQMNLVFKQTSESEINGMLVTKYGPMIAIIVILLLSICGAFLCWKN